MRFDSTWVTEKTRKSVDREGTPTLQHKAFEQLEMLSELLPYSHGHNLALTVLYVPRSLDSGHSECVTYVAHTYIRVRQSGHV